MKKSYRYLFLAIVLLVNFLSCFSQYQVSVMSKELTDIYHMTSAQFARLTTAQMIPSIFLSIPAGSLGDRIGFKKTLLIAVGISAISLTLKLTTAHYALLFVLCIGSGITGAFLNSLNPKMMASEFDEEEVTSMMGAIQASLALGQIAALAFAGSLGVHRVFVISAVIGGISLLAWIFIVKDRKPKERTEKVSILNGFKYEEVILVGLIMFAIYGGFGVITSFLPKKLLSQNVGVGLSGSITAITAGFRLVGSLSFPALLKKVKNQNTLIMILMVMFPILIGLIAFMNNEVILALIVAVVGYTVGGISPILHGLPLRIKRMDKENVGAASGIVSTLMIMGAVLVPSYICAGIAGENYTLLYLIGAGISALGFVLYNRLNRLMKED